MNLPFRYPNITAGDAVSQLGQIRSYLHQLVDQLNVSAADTDKTVSEVRSQGAMLQKTASSLEAQTPKATFGSIKSLIIKSADIVDAYYDQISTKMVGEYTALSEFGEFKQSTTNTLIANSESITNIYTNNQEIKDKVKVLDDYRKETKAYIKTGLLGYDDNGNSIYGLEIGQENNSDNETNSDENVKFSKYARFTSNRLEFYDQNDKPVAWISDQTLHITKAEIQTMNLGVYNLDTSDGIAFL